MEMSESDTGANGHPVAPDDEVPSTSRSSSTLEEEINDGQQSMEDRLLDFVELLFGDLDWDLPDDPELLARLTRG